MKAAVDASEGATDMLSQPGTSYAPGPGVRMRRGIAGGQRGQRGQRLARQGAAASKNWLGQRDIARKGNMDDLLHADEQSRWRNRLSLALPTHRRCPTRTNAAIVRAHAHW